MHLELCAAALPFAVDLFLASSEPHRKAFRSTTPPDLAVEIRAATWEHWLRHGGSPGTASYAGPLPTARVAAAAVATKALTDVDGHHLVVDRSVLAELSAKASKGNERACIALWVAVMMWGSGVAQGRAPWRTAEGLADDHLGTALTTSHRALRQGDVDTAFVAAREIFGTGEAAVTKWLWAASLALPLSSPTEGDSPPPLPSDGPTRQAIETALDDAGVDECRQPTGRKGYAAACSLLATTAQSLRLDHGHRGATPEKLWWLLTQTRGLRSPARP